MSFQYPWLLWGVVAAAIPIVIHLINRQRAPIVRFAALEHLLLSDKRLAQRLKLRQLMVLALRVLLIAVLAIALAKPSMKAQSDLTREVYGPGAVAIIIDDSLSMNARVNPESPPLIELALEEAERALASGGRETSFAVISAGRPARVLTEGVSFDREAVRRALAAILPGPRSGDLPSALREAERVLAETGQARRRILLIGDQAAHAWKDIDQLWALDDPPVVEVIDVRQGAEVPNQAITGVNVQPAPELGADQLRVTTTIANHSQEDVTIALKVALGERNASVDALVGAMAVEEVSVTMKRPEGDDPMGLSRLGDDALTDDNQWRFGPGDGDAIRIGLFNGAPHAVPDLDEVFFLRAALDAKGPGPPLKTTLLNAGTLKPAQLSHLDAVILANPGAIAPGPLSALHDFVQRGGGMLVTTGDRLTDEVARSLGALLPIPMRGHKQFADPSDPNAALSALHIADFDLEHPATALFGAVDEVSLLKARTYRVTLLEPSRGHAEVLASFAGGIPALVEGRLGQGRLMMLTTTVDRDWPDLALRTSFVPLIHQLCGYLAQRREGASGTQVEVGAVASVALPPGRGGLVLLRPDGAEVMIDAPETASEREPITIADIDVVGRYTLRRRGGERKAVHFNAHPDPQESDLTPASPERFEALIGERDAVASQEISTQDQGTERASVALWPYLLLSLFGLLVSEAWFVLRQ